MNKANAARQKANWLAQCLSFGWDKSDLDALSEVWDKYKDEFGNLRPSVPQTPSDKDREIERLKGLIERAWTEGAFNANSNDFESACQQFAKENNL